jgi:7-carboxy-7-deazaguanine synthase
MMRLSELYVSMQGEGPRVGTPTIFVRFGGCNLRCPLWPCDTQHAIDPAYRNEWEKVGVSTLVERITMLAAQSGAENICFTGGEPFLQPQHDLADVFRHLEDTDYHLEAFTNGTLPYSSSAVSKVDMIMDWKLPGSGEPWSVPERFNNVAKLMARPKDHAIKFTISGWEDFVCAKHIWEDHLQGPMRSRIWAGIVWGKMENSQLVEWVLEHRLPWHLNVQVHNHVWDRSQRAI